MERFTAPLLVAFERLMGLIHIRREMTPVSLPDGQQLQIDDFPELAVREALINGFMHRDYHLAGPVSVEHSPEVFVVSSPGPLVGGVTPCGVTDAGLVRCWAVLAASDGMGFEVTLPA